MTRGRFYLKDRRKGKLPLMQPWMRHRQLSGLNYQIINQENIQVYNAGTLRDIPDPAHCCLNLIEQREQLHGRAMPSDPQDTIEELFLPHG
jgi:hypothetical protein